MNEKNKSRPTDAPPFTLLFKSRNSQALYKSKIIIIVHIHNLYTGPGSLLTS